jgi:type I protein arginine methyltransferase
MDIYSIAAYGDMIADTVRTDAYARALRQAVTPDSIVLDIGTGTGIWAMLACQFGARKVYAVEPSDGIQVAREIATANGYAGRIEFIQAISTKITLPESVDIIVSDIRGLLPLYRQSPSSIIDARERLLRPGGTLIPQSDTLWVTVVEVPEVYNRMTAIWNNNPYHLDMQAARRRVTNTFIPHRVREKQLVVEPKCWATLDYTTLTAIDVNAEVTWSVNRTGNAHGLSIWFDTTLAEGIQFSNAPHEPELIFGNAFFPWPTLVPLAVGDTVIVRLQANLAGEDYIWRWDTRILDQGNPTQLKANFKQSTFFGRPYSSAQLHKQADDYIPKLNEAGQVTRLILTLMNNGTALGNIARQVAAQFPARFPTWQTALTRVGELAKTYSR